MRSGSIFKQIVINETALFLIKVSIIFSNWQKLSKISGKDLPTIARVCKSEEILHTLHLSLYLNKFSMARLQCVTQTEGGQW